MERLYNWLLLKAIRGLGEVSIRRLWLRFGSASSILSANREELREILGEEKTNAFFKRDLSFEPERVVKVVEREGLNWMTLEDHEYPALLKEIEDPPPVLFHTGHLKNTSLIGVVGTRRPDMQSLWFISRLVKVVVEKGYGVCSGGAFGCDYHSHRECIELGGVANIINCKLTSKIANITLKNANHYLKRDLEGYSETYWEGGLNDTF